MTKQRFKASLRRQSLQRGEPQRNIGMHWLSVFSGAETLREQQWLRNALPRQCDRLIHTSIMQRPFFKLK